jgi:hypothetical protein
MRALFSGLFVLALSLASASYSVGAAAQEQAAEPAPPARQAVGSDLTGAELNAFVQAIVDRANLDCQVTESAVLGATPEADVYEVACSTGAGMLVNATVPQTSASAVQAMSCLTLRAAGQPAAGCTLTTAEENMAPFADLAQRAATPCTVSGSRFVGATGSGAHFFEYACEGGTGFMAQASAAGELINEVSCTVATTGGGCTLVDVAAARASQYAELTQLAAASGFECQVARSAPFPVAEGSTVQASEIACENRPQSAVVIRDGAAAKVMHCLRAEAEGFRCGFSQPADNYGLLQADLVEMGRDSCVVNGAQVIGRSSTRAYVEATCADGLQGLVVAYALGDPAPAEAIACSQASGIGGCRMDANQE